MKRFLDELAPPCSVRYMEHACRSCDKDAAVPAKTDPAHDWRGADISFSQNNSSGTQGKSTPAHMPFTRQLSPHAPATANLKTPKYDNGPTRRSRYIRQRQSMRAPLLPVRGMSMPRGSETAYAMLQNTTPSSNRQLCKQTRKLPSDDLPPEASALKRRIWESHPGSLLRFRLDKMKRVVTPPVEIPPQLSDPTVLTHLVSGKTIPVTRLMWHQQRDLFKTNCRLARIREGITY